MAKAKKTTKKTKSAQKQVKRTLFSIAFDPLVQSAGKTLPVRSKFTILSDTLVGLDHATVNTLEQYPAVTIGGRKIDRPLNISSAVGLALEMLHGRFLYERVIFATVKFGNTEYRINGQTTLVARMMIDDPITAPKIRWIRYQVETEEELRELYALIDKCRARTSTDVLRALLFGTVQYKDVPMRRIALLGTGLNIFLNSGRSGKINAETRATLLVTTHFNAAKKVLDVLGLKEYAATWRAPVVAALFAVFSDSRYATNARAFRFWRNVITGSCLQENSAEHLLYQYLSACGVGYNTKTKNPVTSETIYRVCILYFKAWVDGGPLERLDLADETCARPTL